MQTFHNDDSAYLKWMDEHDNAFVLNAETATKSTAVLHTSRCMHVHYFGERFNRTSEKKVCSESVDDLRDWARKSALDMKECSTCKPYSAK